VLGDIPVLGALFRSSRSGLEKTNLILILTPYVIREQSDLRTIFERKMQERQEFLDRYFVFSDETDYQPPKDYSRTNGLIEVIRQSFRGVEEKKHLEELLRPKELQTHEPGQPLEMPAQPRTGAAAGGGARANEPTTPAGNTPATPPPAAVPNPPPAPGQATPAPAGGTNPPPRQPRQIIRDVER
jgi:general secretion pathway protein D